MLVTINKIYHKWLIRFCFQKLYWTNQNVELKSVQSHQILKVHCISISINVLLYYAPLVEQTKKLQQFWTRYLYNQMHFLKIQFTWMFKFWYYQASCICIAKWIHVWKKKSIYNGLAVELFKHKKWKPNIWFIKYWFPVFIANSYCSDFRLLC